jgi:hypothetical protein
MKSYPTASYLMLLTPPLCYQDEIPPVANHDQCDQHLKQYFPSASHISLPRPHIPSLSSNTNAYPSAPNVRITPPKIVAKTNSAEEGKGPKGIFREGHIQDYIPRRSSASSSFTKEKKKRKFESMSLQAFYAPPRALVFRNSAIC